MKDLFVELAKLQGEVGLIADSSVTLRDEMEADSTGSVEAEATLIERLEILAILATTLAEEIAARQVGINFTVEDAAGEQPDPIS